MPIGLDPHHRVRRREPVAHQFSRDTPTALRLAAAPPAVEPLSQARVAELFDHDRYPLRPGRELCGVDVVSTPVNGLDRRGGIDQPNDLVDAFSGRERLRKFAVETGSGKGLPPQRTVSLHISPDFGARAARCRARWVLRPEGARTRTRQYVEHPKARKTPPGAVHRRPQPEAGEICRLGDTTGITEE